MGVVARTLASSLLRTARRGLPEGALLNLRPPVDQEWGTFRDDAPPPGFGYQLAALNEAVPGLAVLPDALPLDRAALSRLIKANFRRHAAASKDLENGGGGGGGAALDQGFAALRALSAMLRLERCSSVSEADGVRVEAASQYLGAERLPGGGSSSVSSGSSSDSGGVRYAFSYRIRVTNLRASTIQVLGRAWEIVDSSGALAGHIPLSPANAIVGQQPVLPPGGAFEYTSGTALSTPTGRMRGRLAVAELKGLRPWQPGGAWFPVPVAPFLLEKPPGLDSGGGGGGGSGSGSGSGGWL